MPLGSCPCGAFFACDVTGHKLGLAMSEALVAASGGNWERAWDLIPEKDYAEEQIGHYDYDTHRIIHGGVYRGRRIAGTLFFIKLHEPSITAEDEGDGPGRPAKAPLPQGRGWKRSFSKGDVEDLIKAYDMEALLTLARQDRRIVRDLKRLLYSPDILVRCRTAEALGKVCGLISQADSVFVHRLLQGLFSSVTDTAASSWGAVDAIGEILGAQPERFSGFVPQLTQLSMVRALLPEVLRALGRIACVKPALLQKAAFQVIALLQDPNPEVRGHASVLLGHLKTPEARGDLMKLRADPGALSVYREGSMREKTVGELAEEALARI